MPVPDQNGLSLVCQAKGHKLRLGGSQDRFSCILHNTLHQGLWVLLNPSRTRIGQRDLTCRLGQALPLCIENERLRARGALIYSEHSRNHDSAFSLTYWCIREMRG